MNSAKINYICAIFLLTLAITVSAETVYITDKLNVGLHEDKILDSPIVIIISSGTQLELIKREDKLSYVRDASGATGWVDNSYLESQPPARERIKALTIRNSALQQELKSLQENLTNSQANTDKNVNLSSEHAALQQQFKSERLKVGELQVTIAELRKRLGQDNDQDSLYKEIDTLREINKDLEIQLVNVLDGATTVTSIQTSSIIIDDKQINLSWKNLLSITLVLFIIGLSAGIYLMDYLNRRKHGGFRI